MNKKKHFLVYHLFHSSHISSRKLVEGPLIQFPALHLSSNTSVLHQTKTNDTNAHKIEKHFDKRSNI